MSNSGIYCIENIKNDMCYVGKAVDINKRFKEHKWALKQGIHFNSYLQRAWDKYGEESFKFYILERAAIEILCHREIHWIKT